MILWGISGGVIKIIDYAVKSRRGEKIFLPCLLLYRKNDVFIIYLYERVRLRI